MRGWPMVIAMILGVALVFTLAVYGVGQRPPVRVPAPTVASITVIATSPSPGAVINASAGIGPQLVAVGSTVWVCWTVTTATTTQVYIANSWDGGVTFQQSIPIKTGAATLLQPSLAVDPETGNLRGIAGILHGDRTILERYWTPLDSEGRTPPASGGRGPEDREPGPWGTTALVWLSQAEGLKAFAPQRKSMIAPEGTSFTDPYPVMAGDTNYLVYKATEDKSKDTLWCRAMNWEDAPTVRVDDDTTGAGKLGHSAAWSSGMMVVAYVDSRMYPNRGCLLYTTRSTDPMESFEPSQRLDPPVERAWQVPPTLTVGQGGTLLIGATQSTEHYFPAAYRDKFKRFGISGLHQVVAYCREPVVWMSHDRGGTWESLGAFDDQQIEVSSGGVQAVMREGQLGVLWMESRPITEAPDVRWAVGDRTDMSATLSISATPGDTGVETLYGSAWLEDGSLIALYRDTVGNVGDNYQLVLARSTPIVDDAAP